SPSLSVKVGSTVVLSDTLIVTQQISESLSSVVGQTLSATGFSIMVSPEDTCGTFIGGMSLTAEVHDEDGAYVASVPLVETNVMLYEGIATVSVEGVYSISVPVWGITLTGEGHASVLMAEGDDGITYSPSPTLSEPYMVVSNPVALGGSMDVGLSVVDIGGYVIPASLGVSMEWQGTVYTGSDIGWEVSSGTYSISLSAPSDPTDLGYHVLAVYLDDDSTPFISVSVGVGVSAGSQWVMASTSLVYEGSGSSPFATCGHMPFTFSLLGFDGSSLETDLSDDVSVYWSSSVSDQDATLSFENGVYSVDTIAPNEAREHSLCVAVSGVTLQESSMSIVQTVSEGNSDISSDTLSGSVFAVLFSPRDNCGTYIYDLEISGELFSMGGVSMGPVVFREMRMTYSHFASVTVPEEGLYRLSVTVEEVEFSVDCYASDRVVEVDSIPYYPSSAYTASTLTVGNTDSCIAIGGSYEVGFSLVDVTGTLVPERLDVSIVWEGVEYPESTIEWDGSQYTLTLDVPATIDDIGLHSLVVFLDGSTEPFVTVDVVAAVEAGTSWVFDTSPLLYSGSELSPYSTCGQMEFSLSLLDGDSNAVDTILEDGTVTMSWTGTGSDYPSVSVSQSGDTLTAVTLAPSEVGTHSLSLYVGAVLMQTVSVDLAQRVSSNQSSISAPAYVYTGGSFDVDVAVKDSCGVSVIGQTLSVSVVDADSVPVDTSYPVAVTDSVGSGSYTLTASGIYPEGVYSVHATVGETSWFQSLTVADIIVTSETSVTQYSVSSTHSSVEFGPTSDSVNHRGAPFTATIIIREVSGAVVTDALSVTAGFGSDDVPVVLDSDDYSTYTYSGLVPCDEGTHTFSVLVSGIPVLSVSVTPESQLSVSHSSILVVSGGLTTDPLHVVVGTPVPIYFIPRDACGAPMGADFTESSDVSIVVESEEGNSDTLSLTELSCSYTPLVEGIYTVKGVVGEESVEGLTMCANTMSVDIDGVATYVSTSTSSLDGIPSLVALGDSLTLSLTVCDILGGVVSDEALPVSVAWSGSDGDVSVTAGPSHYSVEVDVPSDSMLIGDQSLSVTVGDTLLISDTLVLAARSGTAADTKESVWVASAALDVPVSAQTCGRISYGLSLLDPDGVLVGSDLSQQLYATWGVSEEVVEFDSVSSFQDGLYTVGLDVPSSAGVHTLSTHLRDPLSSTGVSVGMTSRDVSVTRALSVTQSGVSVSQSAIHNEPVSVSVSVKDGCNTAMSVAAVTVSVTDRATDTVLVLDGLSQASGVDEYVTDLSLPTGEYDIRTTVTDESVHFAVISPLSVTDPVPWARILLISLGVVVVFLVGSVLSVYRKRLTTMLMGKTATKAKGRTLPALSTKDGGKEGAYVRGVLARKGRPLGSTLGSRIGTAGNVKVPSGKQPILHNASDTANSPTTGVPPLSKGLSAMLDAPRKAATPPESSGHSKPFTLPPIPVNTFTRKRSSLSLKDLPAPPPVLDSRRLSFSQVMPNGVRRPSEPFALPTFSVTMPYLHSESESSDSDL
ncbi:hypothetical protein KIPB_004001, partial [Kipferlia bialata]